MTLVKSISGIRGTIGGAVSEGLSPIDIVKFTTGYAQWLKKYRNKERCKIVVGRDARISGEMVNDIVTGTLIGCGCDVINIGLATTPTTELAVTMEGADGGIILTASHNPKQWNALKLLNEKGEFLSNAEGKEMLKMSNSKNVTYSEIDNIGSCTYKDKYEEKHIKAVLKLALVDVEAIKAANFKVVIDCVNSVGGIAIPKLLKALGVEQIEMLNCEPTGHFAHNPEPLPENLTEISEKMKSAKADVGFVVDPDVDRLAIVCENGEMFGEEYTLVSVSDYVLSHTPGNTVSNLSSTSALADVTRGYKKRYFGAAVGEVNVVAKMKKCNAIIGGEGNGGVIYPESHYGRDALVGIALFLSHLAHSKLKTSELRAKYPNYYMVKKKVTLSADTNVNNVLKEIKKHYSIPGNEINTIDGVKVTTEKGWIHMRKSNTEPIIRIYTEAKSVATAEELANQAYNFITNL